MISEISLTFIAVAAIVLTFGFICVGSIFCCCALSSPSIFGTLLCCGGFSLLFGKPDRRNDSYSNNGPQIYQNRGYIESNSYNEAYNSSPQAISQNDDILLAEAYLVAPLVEARVLNESALSTDGILSNKRNFESQGDPAPIRLGEMEQRRPQMMFKDIWAAVIFIIQVIVIIYFAVQVSLKSIKVTDPNYEQLNGLGILVAAFAILGALATLMGTLCLTFVLRNSNYIIEGVMWMNISVCAVGSILCLASGNIIFAGILGILAAVNYCYLNSVRNRIAFASAVLSVACQAIKDNYAGTIIAAYILLVAQLGWFVLWSIASYGIGIQFLVVDDNGSQLDDKGKTKDVQFTGGQFTVLFLMLLSLHWGSEVVRTLLQTTVNGVIACWWFQPLRKAVVRGALFRSVTTSFGSVCFGSFIVSTIHALRDFLKLFSNSRDDNNRSRRGTDLGDLLAKSAECILGLVEQALTYFNKYAYCYVAGYGMGFIESAKKVTQLFLEKGWTAIINDNLISNALTFAVLGMTVITALLGTFSSLFLGSSLERVGITESVILLSIVGALMGFAVSVVLTNALSSGVAMVFVCMAENPDALKVTIVLGIS